MPRASDGRGGKEAKPPREALKKTISKKKKKLFSSLLTSFLIEIQQPAFDREGSQALDEEIERTRLPWGSDSEEKRCTRVLLPFLFLKMFAEESSENENRSSRRPSLLFFIFLLSVALLFFGLFSFSNPSLSPPPWRKTAPLPLMERLRTRPTSSPTSGPRTRSTKRARR